MIYVQGILLKIFEEKNVFKYGCYTTEMFKQNSWNDVSCVPSSFTDLLKAQSRSQGLLSPRPLERERRDPGHEGLFDLYNLQSDTICPDNSVSWKFKLHRVKGNGIYSRNLLAVVGSWKD